MIKRSIASKSTLSKPAKSVVSSSIEASSFSASNEGFMSRLSQYRLPFIITAIVLILIGASGYGVYALVHKKEAGDLGGIKVREGVDPQQIAGIIERVRAFVFTKSDEIPTVATIQDVELLRPQNPSLYRDAENGDKLLVWTDKVVVFSETKDRVLVVMPINANQQAVSRSEASGVEKKDIKIEVRNGSSVAGAAKMLSTQLASGGYGMLNPNDAARRDYSETLIYSVSGKASASIIEELVKLTGGKVVDTVDGEKTTAADVLIVLGGN